MVFPVFCIFSFVLAANKIINAIEEATVIVRAMDRLPPKGNTPTPDEMNAPKPICKNPSNAEALPAFLVNGERAIAAAFG